MTMLKFFIFALVVLTAHAGRAADCEAIFKGDSCPGILTCEDWLRKEMNATCNVNCDLKSCATDIEDIVEDPANEKLRPYLKDVLFQLLAPKLDALKEAHRDFIAASANKVPESFGLCFLDWLKSSDKRKSITKRQPSKSCSYRNASFEQLYYQYDNFFKIPLNELRGEAGSAYLLKLTTSFNEMLSESKGSVDSGLLASKFNVFMNAMKDVADQYTVLRGLEEISGAGEVKIKKYVTQPDAYGEITTQSNEVRESILRLSASEYVNKSCVCVGASYSYENKKCIPLVPELRGIVDVVQRRAVNLLSAVKTVYSGNVSKFLQCRDGQSSDGSDALTR
jgi:hypothetical protein